METTPLAPATRQSFFRRLFKSRRMRRVLFVFAALITFAALLVAEEDWRGARAWANYKHDMEAKGERFDTARLIPPKVPDDQNFAMTPVLAAIFNWTQGDENLRLKGGTNEPDLGFNAACKRATPLMAASDAPHPLGWNCGTAADLTCWAAVIQETNPPPSRAEITNPTQAAVIILDNMKGFEPALAELQAAAARPYCRFNIAYEEWPDPRNASVLMLHLSKVKQLYQILNLRAKAEMVSGRPAEALKDLNVMFRIDDGLKDEPLLISQLVRKACANIMLRPIGEGLAEQRWSEAQLRVLQERLQKTDLLASTVLGFYGERDICWNQNPHVLGDMVPSGWSRLEQLNLNKGIQEGVLARIDLAAREISPSVNHSIDQAFHFQKPLQQGVSQAGASISYLLHHKLLAALNLPGFSAVPQKAALIQSEVDMAMVACALERFRLAEGRYPEELNALVPRFAAALPHDIINGQPLKYRRTDNGRFILYSVGWNEKDDGGVVAATKGSTPRQDILQGDWVWQYPDKP